MSYHPVTFPVKRPLLSMATCTAIADQSEEELTRCIEEGRIRLAFNISRQESSRCRTLRVLATSLAEYLRDPRRLRTETPAQIEAEISGIFPPAALFTSLRTETVARLLGCCDMQIGRLIRAGAFKVTRAGGCGRGHTALVERASVIQFLVQRSVQ